MIQFLITIIKKSNISELFTVTVHCYIHHFLEIFLNNRRIKVKVQAEAPEKISSGLKSSEIYLSSNEDGSWKAAQNCQFFSVFQHPIHQYITRTTAIR